MVNFNLSEEEKKRILNLHESFKNSLIEQSTGTTTPSKYKLPEITDDNKYKMFLDINGSPDMDPTGLYNAAKSWFKKNIMEPKKAGTLTQDKYVEGVKGYTTWTKTVDTMCKYLLQMSATQGITAESFKSVADNAITNHLEINKVPKPYNGTWGEIINMYVGGMQQLKNGMSILITNQLNKIK